MTFRSEGSFIYAESIISQHTHFLAENVEWGTRSTRGIRGVRPGLAWLLPSLAHALIYDREQQKVHKEQEHAEVCSVFRLGSHSAIC